MLKYLLTGYQGSAKPTYVYLLLYMENGLSASMDRVQSMGHNSIFCGENNISNEGRIKCVLHGGNGIKTIIIPTQKIITLISFLLTHCLITKIFIIKILFESSKHLVKTLSKRVKNICFSVSTRKVAIVLCFCHYVCKIRVICI